jgi:hypothetical protein
VVEPVSSSISMEPRPEPSRVQEDRANIFLDTDEDATTGFGIGGIGADVVVNITGLFGNILAKRIERFTGAAQANWSWSVDSASVQAATDAHSLEVSVPASIAGDRVAALFYMTDWEGARDAGDKVIKTFLSEVGGDSPLGSCTNVCINEVGPGSGSGWTELYNPTGAQIDIGGWKIVVYDPDSSTITTYTIPSGSTIASGGYFVLSSITIPSSATVTLKNSANGMLDSTGFSGVAAGESWGRATDGSALWREFTSPSPGGPNVTELRYDMLTALFLVPSGALLRKKWKRFRRARSG